MSYSTRSGDYHQAPFHAPVALGAHGAHPAPSYPNAFAAYPPASYPPPSFAPPSFAPPSYGPHVVPASRESWSDVRGWSVPAPPSTRTAAPSRRGDRGLLVMVGTGSIAILAGFAAVLMALTSEDRPAEISASVANAVSAPAVASPPAWADTIPPSVVVMESGPVAPVATETAPVVTEAPAVPVAPAAVPAKATSKPARVEPERVAVAPRAVPTNSPATPREAEPSRSGPRVVTIALPDAPAAKPAKPAKSAGKTERETLEELLEQQLNR